MTLEFTREIKTVNVVGGILSRRHFVRGHYVLDSVEKVTSVLEPRSSREHEYV